MLATYMPLVTRQCKDEFIVKATDSGQTIECHTHRTGKIYNIVIR